MKITPEERALLTEFAGFMGQVVGLPVMTSPSTVLYIVDRFVKYFDANAEKARALIEKHGPELDREARYG